MNLRRYLLRKAAYVVATVFLILSLNFFLFQILPGDPIKVLFPRGASCGATGVSSVCLLRAQVIHDWGLDQPVLTRYVIYLNNLFHGDLGISITYKPGAPVWTVVAPRLSTTLILVGVATFFTMWLGIILGRVSGWRRRHWQDISITITSLFGYSMPSFWVSLVLVFYLTAVLRVFPVQGLTSVPAPTDPFTAFMDMLWHLVLPVLTFVITNVAWFSLTLRSSLTDVLPEDYMTTAMAKGLTQRDQLRKHALPNARLPVVTASALYFGWVVSGAIVVEQVFGIQGLGQLTWEATVHLDYPLMSAIFLIATLGVVIANAASDVLYTVLDPRVREA